MEQFAQVDAVRSFLRNFGCQVPPKEATAILEAALCYGIDCLSRNFLLRGMTLVELQQLTKYQTIKKKDYYTRKVRHSMPSLPKQPDIQHTKPSHAWRDGDRANPLQDTTDSAIEQRLGPSLMNLLQSIYDQRQNQSDCQRFAAADAQVRLEWLPEPADSASFRAFLSSYVVHCVRQSHLFAQSSTEYAQAPKQSSQEVLKTEPESSKPTQVKSTSQPQTVIKTRSKPKVPSAVGPSLPRPRKHVESKVAPAIRAQKAKILRVKKTQTQLLKERLARNRLEEYDERTKTASGIARQFTKRAPLDSITTATAALEIADDFIRSPIMVQFGYDHDTSATPQPTRDALHEELYGADVVDDAFIGCQLPSKRPPPPKPKTTRHFNGWLGDFGPQHTRVVRPEWVVEDEEQDKQKTSTYEWKFEWDQQNGDQSLVHEDSLSETSDASNPVFQWLKTTVI